MMRTIAGIWLGMTLWLAAAGAQAQPTAPPDTSATADSTSTVDSPSPPEFRAGRFAFVTGSLVAGNVGLYVWEKNRWWREKYDVPFHFHDDLDYAKNLDKVAHFYATSTQALLIARSLEWSGVQRKHAALGGAAAALLIQTHVEYQDGFSSRFGFDRYDQVANILGAAWFYARGRSAFLQHFNVRWNYFPSEAWLDSFEERQENHVSFADDYSGHSYWLSLRVREVLPPSAKRYWPRFLNLSAGLSLNEWQDRAPEGAYRSYYLSLDLDFKEILPQDTWLGRTVSDVANRIHLPFPAIRLYPRPTVHAAYYGRW